MVKPTIILRILKFHEEEKERETGKKKKRAVGIEILDQFLLGEFTLCL